MKKLCTQPALLGALLFLLLPFSVRSQDFLSQAYAFATEQYGLSRSVVGDLRILSSHTSPHNGVTHVHFIQTREGLDIFGTELNLAFLPSGKMLGVNHRLADVSQVNFAGSRAKVAPDAAIRAAAQSLGIQSRATTSFVRHTAQGIPMYDKADISLQDIPLQQGYWADADGIFRPVWRMIIESAAFGTMYECYVDAGTGESLANEVMTLRCGFEHGYLAHDAGETCTQEAGFSSAAPPPFTTVNRSGGQYRVLPVSVESPSHGDFDLITGVESPTASPFGWHDTDGVDGPEFTYTRGNNVHAFADRNWDYLPDGALDGGAGLVFDFPYNDVGEPSDNLDVAVTNLFFWNNVMHDFAHRYGFTEAAGNFQMTNYTGEGSGGDFVEAHSQFGDDNTFMCGDQANGGTECINNADFSTPIDGGNGRMRMFTWNQDVGGKFLDVLEPIELGGKVTTGLPDFGPEITTEGITGEVVIVDDGTFEGSKGCGPSEAGSLDGKIAMIDRGVCDFSLKVYNAQQAGAIGAIICNFEDVVIAMGAGQNAAQVTIPSVFVASGDCERIRVSAGNGLVVSLIAPSSAGPVKRDGSLDNGIIAHEFGHGISTRLAGGPLESGCVRPGTGNAAEEAHGMGEGWSDFFGLVTTVQAGDTGDKRRGIGTFAIKETTNGKGIRSYPYSTDMSVNPHTYDNIQTESLPHGVGSVWCAMLWDMYWAFTDTYGWDPDPINGTGGNNMAIQLVIDGLKLQPCRPSFVEARDAILLADEMNNDGANQCLIWGVFARRGLGANADAGLASSRSDGVEGFDLPIACLDEVRFEKSVTPEVLAGGTIEVNLRVTNYLNEPLTNAVIEDLIPDGCTYLEGSASIEPTVGNSLTFSLPAIAPDEVLDVTYQLLTDPDRPSIRMVYDDIEGFADERWDVYFDPAGDISNFWIQQDIIVNSGISAYSVGDVAVESEHFLQNLEPYTITGTLPVYRFYHYFDTETGADGGFLEITTDDGFSWRRLEESMFRGGYPRALQYGTFAIPNLFAFSGKSDNEFKMKPVYIDLSEYIGEQVKIRYRFGTDANTPGDGWYVDDVEIMDAVIYSAEACLSTDQTDLLCAEAPERGTIVDTELMVSTTEGGAESGLMLMPNPAYDHLQVVMTSPVGARAAIHVYNLTGQLIRTDNWSLIEGINQRTIRIDDLAPGMYLLRVDTPSGGQTKSFMKG